MSAHFYISYLYKPTSLKGTLERVLNNKELIIYLDHVDMEVQLLTLCAFLVDT